MDAASNGDSQISKSTLMYSDVCHDVKSLKIFLEHRPRNARAMSQLSSLLYDQSQRLKKSERDEELKTKSEDSSSCRSQDHLAQEALTYARKAVSRSPHKIFTLFTLSQVAQEYEERVQTLKKISNLFSDEKCVDFITHPSSLSALSISLARLLVEPREQKKRVWLDNKEAAGNPMWKDLSDDERHLYSRLKRVFKTAWSCLTGSAGKQQNLCGKISEEDVKYQQQATDSISARTYNLALMEYKLGMFFRKMQPATVHKASSAKHFEQVVSVLPNDHALAKKAGFWLATIGGVGGTGIPITFDRCPEEYVVSLYSSFASRFDDLLINKLQYETPTVMRRRVDSVLRTLSCLSSSGTKLRHSKFWSRGLDLGCGTGLSGLAFQDCVEHLTGIDLSPEMVTKARERGCYHTLLTGDLEEAFSNEILPFDLIVACDVFVYIGDLDSIFGSVRKTLEKCGKAGENNNSLFAFSTEWLDESFVTPYLLQPTARFAHKKSYIEDLVGKYSFKLHSIDICTIRKNKGKDIKGILVVLGLPEPNC